MHGKDANASQITSLRVSNAGTSRVSHTLHKHIEVYMYFETPPKRQLGGRYVAY